MTVPPGPAPSTAVRAGVRWGTLTNVLEQALTAVSTVVLVRILSPADLGLVAAASVAVALFALLTQIGFPAAIITPKELSRTTTSTLYWLAVGTSTVVGGAVALVAPVLASLLGQPASAGLLAALGGVLVLRVVATVPRALLQRTHAFRSMYAMQSAAALTYPLVAVPAALAGAGPWSLVVGQAAAALIALCGYQATAGFVPALTFDTGTARHHAGLGAGSLALVILSYLLKNVDFWVVSRVGGAAALGVYYVAYVLPNILRVRLTTLGSELLLPLFAALREDDRTTAARASEFLGVLVFLGAPLLLGLAAVTPEVVGLAFGDGWQDAVLPMRIVCLAAVAELITAVSYTVLYARQLWWRVLVLQGVRLAVLAIGVAIAVGSRDLLSAMAAAVAASTLFSAVAGQLALRRELRGLYRTWKALAAVACYAGLMLVAIGGTRAQLPPDVPFAAALAASTAVGALTYVGGSLVILPSEGRRQWANLRRLIGPGSAHHTTETREASHR